ncbi:MAG TPA: hypothetical protein PLF40_29815 [Kofleriaceae bacterium]|nr:hypothetical protein [Kofleriaceae bacterium]
MIEFNDLVNALAQWRLNNGQLASAPLAAQPAPAAPPPMQARPAAPVAPPPRSKAPSMPPPAPMAPEYDVQEFSDVPEDAIEEDGADFAMTFGGAPPAAPPASEFADVVHTAQGHASGGDNFGDGESTMVGGGDRHNH